jgi:hypothetical protein
MEFQSSMFTPTPEQKQTKQKRKQKKKKKKKKKKPPPTTAGFQQVGEQGGQPVGEER